MLSYYSGGVEIGRELVTMGLMLAASSLLIGICLAVSSMNSRVIRGLLILLFIFGFFATFRGFANTISRGGLGLFSIPLHRRRLCCRGQSFRRYRTRGVMALPGVWRRATGSGGERNHDTPQRVLPAAFVFFAFGFLGLVALRNRP